METDELTRRLKLADALAVAVDGMLWGYTAADLKADPNVQAVKRAKEKYLAANKTADMKAKAARVGLRLTEQEPAPADSPGPREEP
jgi:hypothetical protein